MTRSLRKEPALRFAQCSRLPHFALLACLGVGLTAGGCGYEHGWLNPGDVGRHKKEPLLKPILSTLDTGYEEPNDQFTQAVDVDPETDLNAAEVDYLIGKNDLLTVSITDLMGPGVETVKSVRVSESGNVSLPLVGQVRAQGMTEQQLETEIQRAYREANLIPNAQVSVSVAQALARTFSIIGPVNRPGQYQITQSDFRVLDALVASGDVNSQGIDYIYVVRRKDLAGGPARTTAPGAAPTDTTPGAPGTDPLAPRSQVPTEWWNEQPVYLQQAAPAGTTPGSAADTGERYIIVDNKPVPLGASATRPATGATGAAAVPALPTTPAGTTPPVEPTTPSVPVAPTANTPAVAAPVTSGTGTFEFQNPMSAENTRVIRIPLNQLKNGDLRYNIVLRPQDMIIVPMPITGEYYLDGHVNRTGVYNLTARKITLQQAIAAAGGYDQLAIPMKTEIIRRIGEDRQVYAYVNLDKIASGQQPDIYLKPNDIVRVGTNQIAPFIAAFRNAFRITYGVGFLYDRNYAPQQENDNNN
jgi:polysaccharide biosynthesis/export protein